MLCGDRAMSAVASIDTAERLESRIANRTARVGVIGLGYVGLPLAVEFARAGFSVSCIDVSAAKVARINAGDSYVMDVPRSKVRELTAAVRLGATTDFSIIRDLDTLNICVP